MQFKSLWMKVSVKYIHILSCSVRLIKLRLQYRLVPLVVHLNLCGMKFHLRLCICWHFYTYKIYRLQITGRCRLQETNALWKELWTNRENQQRIVGTKLPNLDTVYANRHHKSASDIIKNPTNPCQRLFEPLPSGKRYRAIGTRTNKLINSFFFFFPQSCSL